MERKFCEFCGNFVLNSVCNNDYKRKSDTAGPKHLVKINMLSVPLISRNQMNTLHEIRIKNANRLIIGHLNVNSLRNRFEMLEELIKDKIDIFLTSETKLDSYFPSR